VTFSPCHEPDDAQKRPEYNIAIGKDKTYVLDFAQKPSVVFTEPEAERAFEPGEEVCLQAVLIDPVLNLMISGIKDTTKKVREVTYTEDGKEVTVPTFESLDPTVAITDSSGKEVASGEMPFG
jgi:hypothetical protein